MSAPAIGDVLAFRPAAFLTSAAMFDVKGTHIPYTLRGTVIAVNAAHRHYTLEARCHGYTVRETFKF